MSISDTAVVKRKETILSTKLDDEHVMMDVDSGGYFSLKKVAGRIWELIETDITVADLKAKLMAQYDIDAEACSAEVDAFLNQLVAADIAEIK